MLASYNQKYFLRVIFYTSFLTTALLVSKPAHATLGENSDSVQTDVDTLNPSNDISDPASTPPASGASKKRKANITKLEKYEIHELKTKSGYLKEYVDKAGQVFALTWNGEQPDLIKVFGKHYKSFAAARDRRQKSQEGRSRRFHQVNTEDISVEYGGHMKNLKGRAILTKNIPQGVSADEIQ